MTNDGPIKSIYPCYLWSCLKSTEVGDDVDIPEVGLETSSDRAADCQDQLPPNGVNLTVASIQLLFPDTFNAFADTLV